MSQACVNGRLANSCTHLKHINRDRTRALIKFIRLKDDEAEEGNVQAHGCLALTFKFRAPALRGRQPIDDLVWRFWSNDRCGKFQASRHRDETSTQFRYRPAPPRWSVSPIKQ